MPTDQAVMSRFVEFTRAEWARLRDATPLPLSESQLRDLVGPNEPVSLNEVADVYLPLSRLLNLYVGATQRLHEATATFIGSAPRAHRPVRDDAVTSHQAPADPRDRGRGT